MTDTQAGKADFPAEKKPSPASRQRLAGWQRLLLTISVLAFIFGVFLPWLTASVPVLEKMSGYLQQTGIDPTRYYYTDVEQVKESELYLDAALQQQDR